MAGTQRVAAERRGDSPPPCGEPLDVRGVQDAAGGESADDSGRRNLAVRILQAGLRGYKKWISPLLPRACRFEPTCSEYAFLAIGRYGALRGSLKAVWRVLRCNPFTRGGVDYP